MNEINRTESNTAYGLCNGEIKHISEVSSGLNCGCTCLACNGALVAKKGDKNEHHFAHHNQPEKPCNESIVHRLSKEILQDFKKVSLPALELSYQMNDLIGEQCGVSIKDNKYTLQFIDVKLETHNGHYIPDVSGITSDGQVIDIEIVVSHDIDENKLDKIKDGQHCVLKIYMKDYNAMQSFDTLKNAVIYDAPREWVNNPEIQKKEQDIKDTVMRRVAERNAFLIEKVKPAIEYNSPGEVAIRAPKEDEVLLLGYKSAHGYSPKTKKEFNFSVLHIGEELNYCDSMNYTTRSIGGFDVNKQFYFDESLSTKLEALSFPCIVALTIGNKLKNGRLIPLVIEIEKRE